ncbi:MAG: GNAT family N-acetyltransferase [Promethearchaeota archaeon]
MIKDLIIRQPKDDVEFEKMYDLRWRILRKPWNQPRGSEKDELEQISHPFIALIQNKVIGTIRLQKNNEREGQLRYLAVEKAYRRRNVGKSLILHGESFAKKINCIYIKINARKTAIGFFKKLGYEILSQGKMLYGEIEHFIVKKEL